MFHHRSFKFVVMLAVLMPLLSQGVVLGQRQSAAPATVFAGPDVVIKWNGIARQAAITIAGQSPAHAMISIGFVQAAVYNAVVAIEGGYQPYQLNLGKHPNASVDAAVATAAHEVLVHYFSS